MRLNLLFIPSRRAVGIAAASVVFFLIAWKTQSGLLYVAVSFMLSILLSALAFVMFQFLSGSLSLAREWKGTAVEGDTLHIEIQIVNQGAFGAYNIQIEDNFTAQAQGAANPLILIDAIASGDCINVVYRAECFKRGLYRIGPLKLTLADPFGLFFLVKRYELYDTLLVYPEIFRIYRFPALHGRGHVSWYGIETTHISGDEHEFYGIREYRPGDLIKNIHWRSSARLQTLIVKQFERCSETQTTIVLDLFRGNNIGSGRENTFEYSIKIAGSIARYLLENNYSVQLVARGKSMIHIPFGKGGIHYSRIIKLLSALECDGDVPLSELFIESEPLLPNNSNLILIMVDSEAEAFSRAVGLMTKDISIIPFVLLASTFAALEREESIYEKIKLRKLEIFSSSKIVPHVFCCGENLKNRFMESVK